MKNLVSLVIYDSDSDSYQIISAKIEDGLVCHTFPFPKRSPRDLSDEIDQIKRQKIRRLPHPFKDSIQKFS